MNLNDGLLSLVTDQGFYDEEKSGRKPYTVRWMAKRERNQLFNEQPEFIRIYRSNAGSDEYFTRPIVAIHELGKILGNILIGITFDPKQEV